MGMKRVLGDVRTTILRIPLLHVAQTLCELLDRYILVVLQQIFLCHRARIVDERVGIGGDPSDASDHVSVWDDRYEWGMGLAKDGRTS